MENKRYLAKSFIQSTVLFEQITQQSADARKHMIDQMTDKEFEVQYKQLEDYLKCVSHQVS